MTSGRDSTAARLLTIAVGGGALAGLTAACFIWFVEEGVELVWSELPEQLDLDPVDSWWLFAVPMLAGLLIGIGQRIGHNLPMPIAEVVGKLRSGDGVEPSVIPAAFALATIAIVGGGALGFEAALSCIVGGFATGITRRLGPAGAEVRAALSPTTGLDLTARVRSLAGWIAALSGLFTFRWLPFGEVDLGFRFDASDGLPHVGDGLLVLALGFAVAVPAAWAFHVVVRAEESTLLHRNPIAFGVFGGVALALLAWIDPLVLFSGQQGIASLGGSSEGDLIYLAVAKWLALCIVLVAGWRGGPIFPLWLSFAALGTLVLDPLGVPADLAGIAGITAVSAAFLRGRVLPAVVLTLYAVPLSFTGVMLLAAAGAAIALALAEGFGVLPPADGVHAEHDAAA